MKFTAPLLGSALAIASALPATAGPRIIVTTGPVGGYCAPRPAICPPVVTYSRSVGYSNCRPVGSYYAPAVNYRNCRPVGSYYSYRAPVYSYPGYYYSGYPYGYSSSYYSGPSLGVSLSSGPVYATYTRSFRSEVADDDLAVDVQRALARRGYYRGAIDGDVGPGTRAAIRQYQYDRGLEVTGRIDRSLVRSLGVS